jgi:small-conductance mechanosensitive channel
MVPSERPRISRSVLMFSLALLGFLGAGAMVSFGADPKADSTYLWVRWASLFLESFATVNLAAIFLFNIVFKAVHVRTPRIMRDLLVALAYIVVALMLLSNLGFNPTGIFATSALITAVIGLSFQDTLGNLMGGLALQTERAIGVGDWVRIDQDEGRVSDIRWRYTAIETRNWDTIVIPNSVLMKSKVTVLARRTGQPPLHRQWVYFNVDFRTAPTSVIDAVVTALCAEPISNVALTPPPQCIVMDFKDSYATYAVRYWLTDLALTDPTDSVVRSRVYFALRRAGIPPSIPAQSLFLTTDDEPRRERKHAEEIEHRVEALSHVELFHSLTDDERHELAGRLRVAPFVRGESITRQGATAHWLYIMTKGEAEVRFTLDDNVSEHVSTMHEGDFFGELGMMTGAPRSATIIATTDVECYRLDKPSFDDILRRRPELAEDISRVLARRHAELEALREGLSEEAMRKRMHSHQGDFLQRIKDFFSLEKDVATVN